MTRSCACKASHFTTQSDTMDKVVLCVCVFFSQDQFQLNDLCRWKLHGVKYDHAAFKTHSAATHSGTFQMFSITGDLSKRARERAQSMPPPRPTGRAARLTLHPANASDRTAAQSSGGSRWRNRRKRSALKHHSFTYGKSGGHNRTERKTERGRGREREEERDADIQPKNSACQKTGSGVNDPIQMFCSN